MKLTSDQETFSETIRASLEPVFSDFQQSVMAFSSRFNEPLDAIYVCGGTSLLPGLPEYLSQRWSRRVLPFQIRQHFPQVSIQPQKGIDWLLPIACSLGLSQVSGEARSTVNFRSGKLHVASKGLTLNFGQFIYPAKLALTLYLVAMLSVIGQIFLLNQETTRKDAQLNRALQTVLGRVSASFVAGLKASPAKLKQSVGKKIEEAQASVKGGASSPSSTLNLIHELSKAIPKSTVMEIKQYDQLANKLTLNIDTPSQADAEKAISSLSQFPLFQSPKAGAIEASKGSRRKFSLTTSLKKGT
jgi:hypothetical protein